MKIFTNNGAGLDIVSGGELYRGLKAGCSADRIVYSGVGKSTREIKEALEAGILMFNVESPQELEQINAIAGEMGKKAPVAIRVNPDVDPQTHPYISTGMKKAKFGINIQEAVQEYRKAASLANIEVVGVDCHIGSQLTKLSPFVDAIAKIRLLVETLQKEGFNIRYLDLGGGLGITYEDETPPDFDDYAQAIINATRGLGVTLVFEPGPGYDRERGHSGLPGPLHQKGRDQKLRYQRRRHERSHPARALRSLSGYCCGGSCPEGNHGGRRGRTNLRIQATSLPAIVKFPPSNRVTCWL